MTRGCPFNHVNSDWRSPGGRLCYTRKIGILSLGKLIFELAETPAYFPVYRRCRDSSLHKVDKKKQYHALSRVRHYSRIPLFPYPSLFPPMFLMSRSSYARGAPLPHVLIHGATGSGKTMLARRLVKICGLNTVAVSGGDVGPLGASASSELSRLMRWAGAREGDVITPRRKGKRLGGSGVALVMDEAEAALSDRRY